jgi:hypothetical protein
MSLRTTRKENNLIFDLYHVCVVADVEKLFDDILHNYKVIGDAMGIIVDLTQLTNVTVKSLRAVQKRSNGTSSRIPSVIIGAENFLLLTFIKNVARLTNGGHNLGYCSLVCDAEIWIENWFVAQNMLRQQVQGQYNLLQNPLLLV